MFVDIPLSTWAEKVRVKLWPGKTSVVDPDAEHVGAIM